MLKYALLAVLTMTIATAAVAQPPKKGPNGGMVVVSNGHPIEFVHSGADISFYLDDDDGTPFPAKNLTRGVATIQDGGDTTRINLKAAPPNKLVGALQAPLSAKARIVVSIDLLDEGHKHNLQARFTAD